MSHYLELKSKLPVEDMLANIINIQDVLTLVIWDKNIKTKLFDIMKETFDKDIVIIKEHGLFTKNQLMIQELFRFNGHTLSFVDKNMIKMYGNNLMLLLNTLADVRRKGHHK